MHRSVLAKIFPARISNRPEVINLRDLLKAFTLCDEKVSIKSEALEWTNTDSLMTSGDVDSFVYILVPGNVLAPFFHERSFGNSKWVLPDVATEVTPRVSLASHFTSQMCTLPEPKGHVVSKTRVPRILVDEGHADGMRWYYPPRDEAEWLGVESAPNVLVLQFLGLLN